MDYKEISFANIDDLAQMSLETYSAPPWNTPFTIETATALTRQLLEVDNLFGFCAYQDGKLVGTIVGKLENAYNGVIFKGLDFCVRNNLRGQGIGTQMIKELERRLKQQGVIEIIFDTLRVDETVCFYQKNGFKEYEYLIMMGKRL